MVARGLTISPSAVVLSLHRCVRTVTALVALSFYVLILGPPILLWTALSRRSWLLFRAGDTGIRMTFALVGVRLRVLGREHVLRDRAAVYAANHSSNVDPPAVFTSLSALHPGLRTIYKAELRKLPVLVWVFDAAGFVAIERTKREQSFPAVDHAATALGEGHSFFIFPEGTRSRDGHLLPFKKGGFLMAIAAQTPIVPVAVSGGQTAMRRGSPIIWPVTVTLEFCEPIETRGLSVADRDTLIADVRASIERRLPPVRANVA